MNTCNTNFERLSHAIDQLIYQINQLRLENKELKLSYDKVSHERDIMISKNEAARHRIEQMLTKLEALEVNV